MPAKSAQRILSFPTAAAWDAWLAAEPESSPGVWLKLAKKGARTPTLSRQEAIEGALRHGWIDGQLGALDEHYFLVRFTPRRAGSRWSQKNCQAAEAMIAAGRMTAAGLAQVEAARADGRWDAAYPSQRGAAVPEDLRAALAASAPARDLFERLDSANRFAVLYRVHHAASAQARAALIVKCVTMLARGETFHPLKARRGQT